MPRRIKLAHHLSVADLEQRYRQSTQVVERSHLQIVWLLAQGQQAQQVGQAMGYSPAWIGKIALRYNVGGPNALGDRRQDNPGGHWLLSQEQKARLAQALEQPPPDGGLWNSRKVADWIAQETNHAVYPQRGWDYLRLLDYSPQVPRPRHKKADPYAQETFKKNAPGVCRRGRSDLSRCGH